MPNTKVLKYPENLIGMKFGKLVVIEQVHDQPLSSKTNTLWKCRCECGKEIVAKRFALCTNHRTSCGCARIEIIRSTSDDAGVGKKFRRRVRDVQPGLRNDRLLVIEKLNDGTNKHETTWKCRCDCGGEIEANTYVLTQGKRSCGCLNRDRNRERIAAKLVGQRFGKLTVIGRAEDKERQNSAKAIQWLCRCDCGLEEIVIGQFLKHGVRTQCKRCAREEVRDAAEGSKFTTSSGYVMVKRRNHPNANKHGYVLEHVLVMSEMIGRSLQNDETVHHKNGVKDDNRPENLELWCSNHSKGQRVEDIIKHSVEMLQLYASHLLMRN